MKRKKSFFLLILLVVFLGSIFTLWQIAWTEQSGVYHKRINLPHKFDVSILGDLHFLKESSSNTALNYGYSASNSLSLAHDRNILDTRHVQCQPLISPTYQDLPSTSIVLTYQEVDRSVLLRNIASILNRSTSVSIVDIIVVDDGSSDAEAGQLLARLPGFHLIRNEKSKGRASSRMQGAEAASGEIIVFVDSLAEMNDNWLSPLLIRLVESPKSLVSPIHDVIDSQTFEYKPMSDLFRGGLDWSLQFHWVDVPQKQQARSDPTNPFRTPVQSGAVFAVRKDFFNLIGKYDQVLSATGIEDTELSLRVWLCGGQVEIVPCSRVGLILFKGVELGVQRVPFNLNLRGAKRVAELWLDDYKRFFYAVRPSARLQPLSDLGGSRKLRERHKCQNFKWFISVVYPQLMPLVSDEIAYGIIKQQDNCVDLDPGQLPLVAKLRPCKQDKDSQEWSWRKRGMIVSNGMCLTSDLEDTQGYVVVQFCKSLPSQVWYRHDLQVVHQATGLCLDSVRGGNLGLVITTCDPNKPSQNWLVSSEAEGLAEKNAEMEHDFSFPEDDQIIMV